MHARLTELLEPLAGVGRVGDQSRNIDRLARRRKRAQAFDALVEQDARAVEVAATPMVKAHADLKDAVIQAPVRRAGVAPEQLEGLVLLEELALVELLDALEELRRRWLVAART